MSIRRQLRAEAHEFERAPEITIDFLLSEGLVDNLETATSIVNLFTTHSITMICDLNNLQTEDLREMVIALRHYFICQYL